MTEDILVELSILGPTVSGPTHAKKLPGSLFLAKKVVMECISQGLFLLGIVYTADPSLVTTKGKIPNC